MFIILELERLRQEFKACLGCIEKNLSQKNKPKQILNKWIKIFIPPPTHCPILQRPWNPSAEWVPPVHPASTYSSQFPEGTHPSPESRAPIRSYPSALCRGREESTSHSWHLNGKEEVQALGLAGWGSWGRTVGIRLRMTSESRMFCEPKACVPGAWTQGHGGCCSAGLSPGTPSQHTGDSLYPKKNPKSEHTRHCPEACPP